MTTIPNLKFNKDVGFEETKLGKILKESKTPKAQSPESNKILRLGLHLKGLSVINQDNTLMKGATAYYARQKGQLILGKQNVFNGSLAIVPDEYDGYLSSAFVPSFNINNEIAQTNYVFHLLSQPDVYKRLEIYATGNGSKVLNINDFLTHKIHLPPIDEQNKVARLLSDVDRLIELQSSKIEEYENSKKYFLQQFFSEERPDVYFGSKDELEVLIISTTIGNNIINISAGATPSTFKTEYWENGSIPWMSSGEIHKKPIEFTEKHITDLGFLHSSTKMLEPNHVLIALAGQGKTRGSVTYNTLPLCTNQSIAAIKCDSSKLNYKYLYYLLHNDYDKIRDYSSGDGRGGLNLQMIREYPIKIANNIANQSETAELLSQIDNLIDAEKQSLSELKSMKKSMLQNFFN